MAATATAAAVLLLAAELAGVVGLRHAVDRRHEVSEVRLAAAMQTFRPPDRDGLSRPLDAAALDPARAVRSDPARCSALTVLAQHPAQDGRSWSGVAGRPAQPVTLLTVRYADAAAARAELRDKQLALLRCRRVRLTFPPFDAPAAEYVVGDRLQATDLLGDRLGYALVGQGRTYGFYLRRFGNTLTWTYGDDVSTPRVRHEVAESLVTRLRELERG